MMNHVPLPLSEKDMRLLFEHVISHVSGMQTKLSKLMACVANVSHAPNQLSMHEFNHALIDAFGPDGFYRFYELYMKAIRRP